MEWFSVDCVYRPLNGIPTPLRAKLRTSPPVSLPEFHVLAPIYTIVVSDDEWDVNSIDTGGDKIDLEINGEVVTLSLRNRLPQSQSGTTSFECG